MRFVGTEYDAIAKRLCVSLKRLVFHIYSSIIHLKSARKYTECFLHGVRKREIALVTSFRATSGARASAATLTDQIKVGKKQDTKSG